MITKKNKLNKVLLIFPPVVFSRESPKQIMPPLGISYLGAVLRKDYEVRLLDAALEGYNSENFIDHNFNVYGLKIEEIKKKIREFTPDVVGITCLYSSQFRIVVKICDAIKEISRDIITIIGGTHPTFLAKECLKFESIDYVVLGEGEFVFKQLLDSLNNNVSAESINGIAFRKNGEIRENPNAVLIEDLDKLPFPAREMLPLEKYFKINLPMGLLSRKSPAINLITSRGCVYNCSFCSSSNFWGKRYRARSAENVLEEMACFKTDLGIEEIKFFDDNLTLDGARAKKIFKGMIDRKFNFSWNTPNGIDINTLDKEMIDLMKKSGCYELTLAVESGDAQVLKNIVKKQFKLEKVLNTAKMIKEAGLDTYGFFIIGFPGETKKEINNTLRFIDKLRLDRISLFIANPLPGSEIYKICEKKGYLKSGAAYAGFDYFQSRFETPEFDAEFLERTRRFWYWTYNLKLIIRNPLKFFKNYSMFILKRPLFLLRLLWRKIILPEFKSASNR